MLEQETGAKETPLEFVRRMSELVRARGGKIPRDVHVDLAVMVRLRLEAARKSRLRDALLDFFEAHPVWVGTHQELAERVDTQRESVSRALYAMPEVERRLTRRDGERATEFRWVGADKS